MAVGSKQLGIVAGLVLLVLGTACRETPVIDRGRVEAPSDNQKVTAGPAIRPKPSPSPSASASPKPSPSPSASLKPSPNPSPSASGSPSPSPGPAEE